MKIDRKKDWKEFSDYMLNKFLDEIVPKYGKHEIPDLVAFTKADEKICAWNIMKYALRIWKGKNKPKDFEKIAHYAQMAWTMNLESQDKETKQNYQDKNSEKKGWKPFYNFETNLDITPIDHAIMKYKIFYKNLDTFEQLPYSIQSKQIQEEFESYKKWEKSKDENT